MRLSLTGGQRFPQEDQYSQYLKPETSNDPNVHIGKDMFCFPNGDVYDGSFYATNDNQIWRHGKLIVTV